MNVLKEDGCDVWKSYSIEAGAFYDSVIPEQIESLWGPIPLERLPPGVDNNCKAVTHKILDGNKKVLSVYLIHSLPLEMSAIQLFIGERMSVVAHLVYEDTIGHEKSMHLNGEVNVNRKRSTCQSNN